MGSLDLLRITPLDLDYDGQGYRSTLIADLQKLGVPEDTILTAAKGNLNRRVDGQAEELRAKVLTPGSGQALEYQEVQAQAFAAAANPGTATPALYPMLAATIGIDIDPQTRQPATDVLGVARAIMVAYTAWNTAGAAIRTARLKGKAAIDAATTVDAAAAAFDAIAWPAVTA